MENKSSKEFLEAYMREFCNFTDSDKKEYGFQKNGIHIPGVVLTIENIYLPGRETICPKTFIVCGTIECEYDLDIKL